MSNVSRHRTISQRYRGRKGVSLFTADLIAPCGMNCGVCSAYLAFTHHIPKKRGQVWHCAGCRARNKQCSYLKGQCQLLSKGRVSFCSECPDFPCMRLKKIDNRYRTTYGISFIQNLEEIRDVGVEMFLDRQTKSFLCGRCRQDVLSIHNNRCYRCEKITSWR